MAGELQLEDQQLQHILGVVLQQWTIDNGVKFPAGHNSSKNM